MLPGALVAVLVAGQGVLQNEMVWIAAGALLALAAVRVVMTYQRLVRQLSRFSVHVEMSENAKSLAVRAGARTIALRPESIERLVEIGGSLGGVRLYIAESDRVGEVPARIDVPRGGSGFPILLRALITFAPEARFEPPKPRSRVVRVVRGVGVVAALFFLPFFAVDFVHRSRLLAYALALLVFVIVRAALRPQA